MEKVKFDPDNINLAKITPLNKPNGEKKNHGRVVWLNKQDLRLECNLRDPFVDDSEDYDETIPEGYDTERDGFYVNGGPLNFKKVKSETTNKSSAGTTAMSSNSVKADEIFATYKKEDSVDGSNVERDTFMKMQKDEVLSRDGETSRARQGEFDVSQEKALQMELRANDVKLSADALFNIENFKEVVRATTCINLQVDEIITTLLRKVLESLVGVDQIQRYLILSDLGYSLLIPQEVLFRKAAEIHFQMLEGEMDRTT